MNSDDRPPTDLVKVELGELALHQAFYFDAAAEEFDRHIRDPSLFRRTSPGYEWTRLHEDDEEFLSPLGTVSFGRRTCLLETVTPLRMRRLHALVWGRTTTPTPPDETRSLPFGLALRRPEMTLQPAHDSAGTMRTALEIASVYIRSGWAFSPHAALAGRLPALVATTGKGRDSIRRLIPGLEEELRAGLPELPTLLEEFLVDLLLPEPLSAPEEQRATTPNPRSGLR